MLSTMTKGRRQLRFANLAQVTCDVERLLENGHRPLGRWTLAQICNHLSESIRYSLDGFPGRRAPWPVRVTLGKLIRGVMLTTGRIKEGVPLAGVYQPDATLDAGEQLAILRETIERFESADVFKMHPLIGQMTRQQWEPFHCIHCAHHLSFVIPLSAPPAAHRS